MADIIAVDFRPRQEPDEAWARALLRAFVTRWEDGATYNRALRLWCMFMDQRRTVPADAAKEVWDYLWALFLRTEGVRVLTATHRDGAA